VEAIASLDEHLYGIQWHPEVSHTVNGRLLFENFDRICSE
jgi:GMP synthase (glutamine-hydrolysing)